ncbi:MAG: peptidylprolyl isomerase [Nitrospinales bacterium]
MIIYFKPLFSIIIIILLNSCFNNNPSVNFIVDDEIVLEINDEKVTSKQFKKMLAGQQKIFRVQNIQELKPEELSWFKNRVLDEVVKETLISQEISKNNITIDQNEFNKVLNQKREGYVEDALEKILVLEKVSREDWENSIKNTALTNKLIQEHVNSKVSVSEKEMREYFDKSDEFHKKEQVRALHIMVESEEEIRNIQKEIRRKQKTFSRLAKQYSLGPEGIQGGDLGFFEAGQMPEEFDDVFKLKINKISDIIRTPYGFHLFKVVGKVQERKMDFEESKSSIKKILLRDLQDKAFQKWFLKLKRNARIDIKYDVFDKIN